MWGLESGTGVLLCETERKSKGEAEGTTYDVDDFEEPRMKVNFLPALARARRVGGRIKKQSMPRGGVKTRVMMLDK